MGSDDGEGLDQAQDFYSYVRTTFPKTAGHWEQYTTESEFVDIIQEGDYSRDPMDDRPAFSAGIIFTAGSPNWAYTVRGLETSLGGGGGGGVPLGEGAFLHCSSLLISFALGVFAGAAL